MLNVTEPERVRANTAAEVNWRIDQQIEESIRHYSGQPKEEISRRIWELEQEWDIERVLQAMASSFSLMGIAFSIVRDRRWIILPGVVLSFLLLHAIENDLLLRMALPLLLYNITRKKEVQDHGGQEHGCICNLS